MLEPLDLLTRAVAISSISGHEREVAEYLVSQMQTFASEAFIDAVGNAVARLGTGERHVMFLGHIDTVPGDIPVRVEDGWLWGRGTVDAKGPFCTAVAAVSQLGPEVLERLSITLVGAVEEEAPTSKGARHALEAYPKPDLVIIGEPSGWDAVTLGYKGRLVMRLSLEKDNFHSAGNDTTAAEDMVAAWERVRSWADGVNEGAAGLFDRLQAALQSIRSEDDGLRQQAQAVVSFRLPLVWPPDRTRDAVRQVLPEGLHIAFIGAEIPYRSEKDTLLSRAFRVAIRQEEGQPRFKVKTGTSDMNVVAPHWDVPMLAYGPGDSGLDHRPDERLELAEFERAVRVLCRVFERLAEG